MAERESPLVAWQIALVDVLGGIGFPVHAGIVPQVGDGGSDVVFPHIRIDEPVATKFDTTTKDGLEFVQRVHVRWRGTSTLPGKRIMAEVYDLLHHGALALDGWRLVLLQQEQAFVTPMAGEFDGISEFRGLIEKT